jgi:rSAM/selenodomain-associated transferase 1
MSSLLYVVAKQPAPGQTKTRLCPPLDGHTAATLYSHFLADTLEIMRQVPGVQRGIAYLPHDADGFFRRLAPDMHLVPQRGETLGERLDHLIDDELCAGAAKVVVMDSDSPTLPATYVAQAFACLDAAEVVFGPCRDGGYYLVGMTRPHPRLLREVTMSTPHVLADSLALAETIGARVALLPAWYDVDTAAELDELRAELAEARNGTAAHTRRFLAGWNGAPLAEQTYSQP